jgi:hypothetical protein
MKRIVLPLFVLVLAVPVFSVAQARPDFTGRWVKNQQKSDVGKKPPQPMTMVIKQTATRIVIEQYQGGKSRTIAYALDGSESTTKHSEAGKNLEVEKSRARWEGNTLVIESGVTHLESRNTRDKKQVFSLSSNGKELTRVVIYSDSSGPRSTNKVVFNKQYRADGTIERGITPEESPATRNP